MIAAFLPLPLNPKLDMEERDNSTSNLDSSNNVPNDYARQFGPMDEARYESAKWWRYLNRWMSAVGILIIAVVVSLLRFVKKLSLTVLDYSGYSGYQRWVVNIFFGQMTPRLLRLLCDSSQRLVLYTIFLTLIYKTLSTRPKISLLSTVCLHTLQTITKVLDDFALYPCLHGITSWCPHDD